MNILDCLSALKILNYCNKLERHLEIKQEIYIYIYVFVYLIDSVCLLYFGHHLSLWKCCNEQQRQNYFHGSYMLAGVLDNNCINMQMKLVLGQRQMTQGRGIESDWGGEGAISDCLESKISL